MHLPLPLTTHSRHVHLCPWLWAWPLWPPWPMSSKAKPGEGCVQVEIWRRIQRFLHSFASALCQRNGMSCTKGPFCPGSGLRWHRCSERICKALRFWCFVAAAKKPPKWAMQAAAWGRLFSFRSKILAGKRPSPPSCSLLPAHDSAEHGLSIQ